jgi:hypothetical protein
VGIVFLEDKVDGKERTFLRTDLAFRYTDERRFQYYPTRMNVPDVVLFAPRVGVSFRYALNESVRLTEDAEVLPNVVGPPRVLFNSNTKLLTRITETFSLSVSFLLQHDSLPAEGRVPTDTGLTVGVEVAL